MYRRKVVAKMNHVEIRKMGAEIAGRKLRITNAIESDQNLKKIRQKDAVRR